MTTPSPKCLPVNIPIGNIPDLLNGTQNEAGKFFKELVLAEIARRLETIGEKP